jgi:hypothetical protein
LIALRSRCDATLKPLAQPKAGDFTTFGRSTVACQMDRAE